MAYNLSGFNKYGKIAYCRELILLKLFNTFVYSFHRIDAR